MEADYGNPNIYSALQEEENKLDNRALENVYDEINRGVPTRASRKSLESKSSKSFLFATSFTESVIIFKFFSSQF